MMLNKPVTRSSTVEEYFFPSSRKGVPPHCLYSPEGSLQSKWLCTCQGFTHHGYCWHVRVMETIISPEGPLQPVSKEALEKLRPDPADQWFAWARNKDLRELPEL
jgi:hypothetical protein